jgi:hypothetical protein
MRYEFYVMQPFLYLVRRTFLKKILFRSISVLYNLEQRDPTGGSRATSDPRSLITKFAKLFVNLLLVTKI